MSLFDKSFALSIGPQRCGTAQLERYFRGRSDVCLPAGVKEIFFFDRHFQRGADFYASHFSPQPGHQLIMELSTTAFDAPDAPEHVAELFGTEVMLFCPLRHPVARSYAVYQDYLRYGIVSGSIESAVEQAPQILHSSRYADHISPWFARFGREEIKILFYEDLERNKAESIKHLCDYLSLPFINPEDVVPHREDTQVDKWPRFLENLKDVLRIKTEKNVADPDEARAWLADRLADDIKRFEEMTGFKIPDLKPDE